MQAFIAVPGLNVEKYPHIFCLQYHQEELAQNVVSGQLFY
jgi:hypothetical protein